MTADRTIHTWDIARAIGGNEQLDDELVRFVYGFMQPHLQGSSGSPKFYAPVALSEDASLQDRLIALPARQP